MGVTAGPTPSLSTTVSTFQGGMFVVVSDSRITSAIVTVMAADDVETGSSPDFPDHDSLTYEMPLDLLPTSLTEGFRVFTFATDGGNQDQAPILIGSVTEFPEPSALITSMTGKKLEAKHGGLSASNMPAGSDGPLALPQ